MITVSAVKAKKQSGMFDLYKESSEALRASGQRLETGDVLVISTKYAAVAEGRTVSLSGIAASAEAQALAKEHGMSADAAEVVLREADRTFGGAAGFVMAQHRGVIAPNAGIDRSNSGGGSAILYPQDPFETAEQVRRKLFLGTGVHAGVILADSRLAPARAGTGAVAVAWAGIEPVIDRRGQPDLDGAKLRVTRQAAADNMAAIASHIMGEAAESQPLAVVRGSGVRLTHKRADPEDSVIPHGQCVYVRGLQGAIAVK